MSIKQDLASCFAISVPCSDGKTLYEERLAQAQIVQTALSKLLRGEFDIEQFLDCVEPIIGTRNMEAYIKEVLGNLESPLEQLGGSRGETSPLILP